MTCLLALYLCVWPDYFAILIDLCTYEAVVGRVLLGVLGWVTKVQFRTASVLL